MYVGSMHYIGNSVINVFVLSGVAYHSFILNSEFSEIHKSINREQHFTY